VATTYETDYFTVVASGTFTDVCTDDGMFMSGTLTFTAVGRCRLTLSDPR